MEDPLIDFPAHWAPNDLEFYDGTQFPERYRGGAFVAFHGSWNRAPEPQGGYNVVFAPFEGNEPTGAWEVFAEGFSGADVSPRGANHRPTGLAMGPDGSLYISDSQIGRIWRITYTGE
jgi:glucose/arabinose dehydrogenase